MELIKHIIRKIEETTGKGFGDIVVSYNATASVILANNQTEKEESTVLPLSWSQIVGMSMAAVVAVVAIVGCLYKMCFCREVNDSETDYINSMKEFSSSCQQYSQTDAKSPEKNINISQSTDHDSYYDDLSIISQARYDHPEVTSHIGYNLQSDSGVLDHSNEESLINSMSTGQELSVMGNNAIVSPTDTEQ